MFRTATLAAAFAALAVPAFAADITIKDAYARSSNKMAGAAFMEIHNAGAEDDRLIAARSDISKRVELHTHIANAEGVMRMVEVEDGFPIPAGGNHVLKRGGDHVMFMGLNQAMTHGEDISVTLVFEKAGDVDVTIPVDLERKPMHGMAHGKMDHSKMDHGKMDHGKMDHGKMKKN